VLRAARTFVVLATIASSLSCQTLKDPYPPQATLNVDITDTALGSQVAPLPSPQVVAWRVDELTASNITGYDGTYSFLYSGPCSYQLNALAVIFFASSCGTSGLTLSPDPVARTADLRFVISRLELRAAARPDLTGAADPDGDGVPNTTDNCPIVYNPDQANSNAGFEGVKIGDACSDLDLNDQPTIADQDLDGVADSIDNCLWYPNPLLPGETRPADSNRDGIGDACERIAPVALPNGRLTLECDNALFTPEPSRVAFFRLDFGRPGVLTCDAGFTGCILDPSALKVGLVGNTPTFSCHSVP